ncbi:hypothetical protein AKL17_3755 [Frigidibacter mobilis]|uniref:Uncharacterized protein n=1 Tax=Frigidibacter mobilis TaxID=1335048 RepID=A0A159Z8F4_9RHOB|nr:hypothetical protein AKL17_3755 [Frigidibacter mobilis]
MPRIGEEPAHRGPLDHAAGIHHGNMAGGAGHHAQIMRHQQHGHAHLGLKIGDQVEDLRLDGHVERGGRLVRDQQPRPPRNGQRDHRPLVHAARKAVRVIAGAVLGPGDADAAQQAHRLGPGFGLRGAPAQAHRLGNLPADAANGVEAAGRVLEHAGHGAAAQLERRGGRQAGHVGSVQLQGSGGYAGAARQEARHRKAGHRLAAAGFAYKCKRLARIQAQRDLAHRQNLGSIRPRYADAQLVKFKYRHENSFPLAGRGAKAGRAASLGCRPPGVSSQFEPSPKLRL